jgi:hypothetical protein
VAEISEAVLGKQKLCERDLGKNKAVEKSVRLQVQLSVKAPIQQLLPR